MLVLSWKVPMGLVCRRRVGIAPGVLKLTGPLLADIYLEKVQSWADPAIRALNPDLNLPGARIGRPLPQSVVSASIGLIESPVW
jgi:hypothetical protein